ncbi:dodecin domain-containing protein [bacterium]|nr:dodecin domain-containing protein [bacterium]
MFCIFFSFLVKIWLNDFRRFCMDIEKHLIITGSSEVSWKDAIVKAISEASKSIDYLSGVKILEQRANIDGNKISEYFVDLDISFLIDLNRKDDR